MKITDFALIFIAIMLPFMLVLYINITFTIKAEEMEMYYQNLIDTAAADASYEMKQVESSDAQIDYGYSGSQNKKINVNAQVGVDTFLDTLYNNLGIAGNESAEEYMNLFVPAIAVVEYDGIRVSTNETIIGADGSMVTKRVLKPKRYFTFTYSIVRNGMEYVFVPGTATSNVISTHIIEFTLDDLITHRGYDHLYQGDIKISSFYVGDSKNNDNLIVGVVDSGEKNKLKSEIVTYLLNVKQSIISSTVTKELAYAVNSNNFYARQAGVSYDFSFPTTGEDEMYNMVNGVGIIAFVQGISVGNKYLNTKAYGMSTLEETIRYYFTAPNTDSKVQMNLYHKDISCPEYRLSKVPDMSPRYANSKQEAATSQARGTVEGNKQIFTGFYPCPICSP